MTIICLYSLLPQGHKGQARADFKKANTHAQTFFPQNLTLIFKKKTEPADRRRVQQCQRSRALIVLVPIFFRNV